GAGARMKPGAIDGDEIADQCKELAGTPRERFGERWTRRPLMHEQHRPAPRCKEVRCGAACGAATDDDRVERVAGSDHAGTIRRAAPRVKRASGTQRPPRPQRPATAHPKRSPSCCSAFYVPTAAAGVASLRLPEVDRGLVGGRIRDSRFDECVVPLAAL